MIRISIARDLLWELYGNSMGSLSRSLFTRLISHYPFPGSFTIRSVDSIQSLDYYYKPSSAIQIDGLNTYENAFH